MKNYQENKMEKNYIELLEYINTIKIIDTHEHLPTKEENRDKVNDVLMEYLTHYFNSDLKSAGLSNDDYQKIFDPGLSIKQKWQLVKPYWNICRHTGYGRALDIAAKGLYGIDKIDGSTIEKLNNEFLRTQKPGYLKTVLKDKCKITTSLLNVDTLDKNCDSKDAKSIYCDRELYNPVYVITDIIFPRLWSHIENVEKQSGIRVTSFSRWLEAIGLIIVKAIKLGAVALKSGEAYMRTIKYDRVTRMQAEKDFNDSIFKSIHFPDWREKVLVTGKDLQDYILHFILDIANKMNLIVQIHTGIQEGGNILSNSNSELLSNLFLEYPEITFDIFHISYPYQNELTVLAKNFPNVYIDMCWAHIISPNASVESLLEWIDTVPLNKISAFGGDYSFVDGVYGHLQLAKENVAKALSIKVSEDLFDIDKAKEISKMLFFDNPFNIFKLEGKI